MRAIHGGRAALTGSVGRIVFPPSEHLLGGPADVKAHLRYARKNIERSRMLFGRRDIRYAVFSANEGLELCVKAYLVHYKIIADPIKSRHFPYPALIRKLREFAGSFEDYNPGDAGAMTMANKQLDRFEAFFKMLESREKAAALWKWSLDIPAGPEDQKHLEEIDRAAPGWGEPEPCAQGGRPQDAPEADAAGARGGQDDFIVGVLGLFHKDRDQKEEWFRAAPSANGDVPLANLMYSAQVLACLELFLYTNDILRGYVHQQPSRYPTMIDGVDSGTLYLRHEGAVGRLLAGTYRASGELMRHLDGSSAPALRSSDILQSLGGSPA